MFIIGITGGIGAGKTTVSDILRAAGYRVYNADRNAALLQNTDEALRRKTVELLGEQAYSGNVPNRKFISSVVFNKPDKLLKLNNIIHPAVKTDFEKWKETNADEKLLFMESALLYETEFYSLCDKIILITASNLTRIQRVMQRDNLTEQQVAERIKNQLSDEQKMLRADFVICNENDVNLEQTVKQIIEKIMNCYARH